MATATTTPAAQQVRAQARYLRTSAQKARVVLEHIRGKSFSEARATLTFIPRAAARDILKILESAGANAEHNLELAPNEFVIDACYADEGPTLKRFKPRARGRAGRIMKRTCHVTIVLRHAPDATATKRAAATAEAQRSSAAEATIQAESSRRKQRKADAEAASAAAAAEAAAAASPAAAVTDATTAEIDTPDAVDGDVPAGDEAGVADEGETQAEAAAEADAEADTPHEAEAEAEGEGEDEDETAVDTEAETSADADPSAPATTPDEGDQEARG